MSKHPHADLLMAVAEGQAMQGCCGPDEWVGITAEEALRRIAAGHPVRIKPREPRRIWVNEYMSKGATVHASKQFADTFAHQDSSDRVSCIEFVEVLP